MARKRKKLKKAKEKKDKKEKRRKGKDTEQEDDPSSVAGLSKDTQKGIVIVALFALALLLLLSMFGGAGRIGGWLDTGMDMALGWGKYVAPLVLIVFGYILIFPEKYEIKVTNYIGLAIFVLSFFGLFDLLSNESHSGGYLGYVFGYTLEKALSFWGALVVLIALFAISWLLMFNWSLSRIMEKAPSGNIFRRTWYKATALFKKDGAIDDGIEKSSFVTEEMAEGEENPEDGEEAKFKTKEVAGKGDGEQMELMPTLKRKRRQIAIPLELLEEKKGKPSAGDIDANKEKIKQALDNFGIEVDMADVSVGPTVTQYAMHPAEGVKISQITTLSNDLALALAAHPVRIEAPIPGKSLVGIEVPNKAVAIVGLKEMLASSEFKKQRKSDLTICLGRDVSGKMSMVDLGTMPHLLIAGATGSGKSVCINAIIMSLLFQNGPDDLKLILVDPKRVEFTVYNDIPHLLTPVITDVKKTINALKWVVAEMDRRYELLSQSGKRDINAYNSANPDAKMPFIVLVVDELADLMATAARDVEAAITRLAQMARAVGIHLVLATQRPSVDVITGLIKANITSRIAFNVASLVDSRTILDHSGAEKLLGKGDMLYISASLSSPKRLQGALLTDHEIENVANFLKGKAKPEYTEDVTEIQTSSAGGGANGSFDEAEDELLPEAKEVVIRAQKASASLLQRRLRIGYARAARILDIMEEQGIIGPADGAKPREILVKGDKFFERDEEQTGNVTEDSEEEVKIDEPEISEENNSEEEEMTEEESEEESKEE
ncbi:DNA translocase FtsK [Patescibacteria group bacterium]|nr:DNA translocase FtsK [Patescibacteria group bacterium]MBU1674018.1 DNA translocase FtsK [Patescibacteria group bacterium]MBU1963172.1 DNA translocase FtsK [Patescibacteria group bacterium]